MKKTLLLSLLWCNINIVIAQTTYSKEVEVQIKGVENNLGGRLLINGKPYNILDRMAEYKVKGVSIAVIKNYKMIWTKGYGWADEKEKRPVTEKTLFHIASNGKCINAMAVLKLAQDKKLDLNADINNYLTTWKFPYDSVSKGKKITTLHLLSHTAGLSNESPSYYFNESVPTLIQELNGSPPSKALGVHSILEPGIEDEYSNPGIGITQLMISDITKKNYDKYINETVLRPLGMNDSYYSKELLDEHKEQLATGYNEGGIEVPGKRVFFPNMAAGGLWTTASDLCKFTIELQLSYIGRSNKVLNQEMTKKMLTPVMRRSAPGTFITEKGGIKYFYHGGDVQGFTSDFYSTVEGGNGVVVLVNGYHVREFINEIVNSVATVYKWKDFYDPLRKNEMIVPENILSNYTGTYLFDSLLVTILKKDKDYFYISDGTYSKMHFTTEKDFYNAEFTSEKTFLIDASGSVKGFLRYLNGDTLTTAVKVNDVETLKAPFSQLGWVGWYYLENNQYENAIRYIRRSLALNPKDINGVLNLAHCYLFKNDYNEAIKLYGQFLSSDITDPNVPNKKVAVKQDFILLENKGFDKNLMNKVTADLKL